VSGYGLRAVVFDLDGVIVDSEHLWEESWAEYARRQGYRWTLADTLRLQGMSAPEWSRAIAELVGDPGQAPDVTASCVGYVVDAIRSGEGGLLPGARQLLIEVSDACPIAMASSAPRVAIDAVLVHNGIADLFATTVSSEEVPRGKPSPDVYAEAMRRLAVGPGEGAAVEDSSNGIRAAHAAGLLVVALPNPKYPPKPDALDLAEFVAPHHDDVRGFLLSRLTEGTRA
jgi:HAD superfamily hydrolase (TIGR01509 family)